MWVGESIFLVGGKREDGSESNTKSVLVLKGAKWEYSGIRMAYARAAPVVIPLEKSIFQEDVRKSVD